MSLIKRICEARLRDCLPLLCVVVVGFNLTGYFFGLVSYRELSESQTHNVTPIIDPRHSSGVSRASTPSSSPSLQLLPFSTASAPSPLGTSTVTWKPPAVPCSVTSRSGRGKDYGRWYSYGVSPFQFYAYSALWDDRESLKRQDGVVRVIAVSSTRNSEARTSTDAHNVNIDMSCRLYYPDGHSIVVPMETNAHPIGYGWWLNGEHIREFIFTCSSASQHQQDQIPVALEVLLGHPSWSYSSTESCMPIDFPDKPATKRDLAICVQVTYGQLNALRLMEWFELQRLLGVELIGIYNMSIVSSVNTVKVLEHYSRQADDGQEPLVDLRRSDYIPDGAQQFLLHGSPVINDCIYRNMFRFKRIVVVDLDEYIIPQGKDIFDLRQLVANIDSMFSSDPNPPPNFAFANNYFFFNSVQPSASSSSITTVANIKSSNLNAFLSSEMTVLKYLTRVPVSPHGYSVKSIIDPQACLHMHNHLCWGVTPQFSDRKKKFAIIDSSVALNQHYKFCHFDKPECDRHLNQTSVNDVTLKYRNQLIARVAAKIRKIFGDSSSIVESN